MFIDGDISMQIHEDEILTYYQWPSSVVVVVVVVVTEKLNDGKGAVKRKFNKIKLINQSIKASSV